MDKKICVVSMSVGKPASMTAAWINNELIMAERTSYPERRRDMGGTAEFGKNRTLS
ncbi:hypothetical protein ACO0KN_21840 [Escherichia coli]|uniref:hypothetical protein n=1 Tax=Escherichia coli TaxID=562 RepID=UPI003BF5BB19